jgi:hypothetical protein
VTGVPNLDDVRDFSGDLVERIDRVLSATLSAREAL